MKNINKKKGSTAKKLMPAAMMLAVSASMLGTSTYAWFTMNKVVEVTGLQMQATSSSGLEISMGALGTPSATKAVSVNTPAKGDISWKRTINVKEYYTSVGKLLPASSDDALDIYTVPAADVYAGGHAVTAGATISAATKAESANLNLQTYGTGTGYAPIALDETTGAEGNYIDIPMWIRSSNQADTPVYATVTITDPNTNNGSDLIKAVRVALIPIATADEETDSCDVSYASSSYTTGSATVSPLSGSAASIFGLKANGQSTAMDSPADTDWPTYHGKVINATGDYVVSGTGATLGTTTILEARGVGTGAITPTNPVFTIPAATADDYGRVGFVARIWLEGESIYCEDATANQDWNIEFHFDTDTTAMTALT